MHAALHRRDHDISHFADYQAAGVAFGGGARKAGNFLVGNFRCARKFIGERAEARTEDHGYARAQARFGEDEFRGARGSGEFSRRALLFFARAIISA